MKVGFTGTQVGMSGWQKLRFIDALKDLKPSELHHGDCVGADAQAAGLARACGARVVAHPPSDPKKRAYAPSDESLSEKPYIERNHDIVDATDVLIAAPKTEREELRSGTWATVRYARRVGKRVILLA